MSTSSTALAKYAAVEDVLGRISQISRDGTLPHEQRYNELCGVLKEVLGFSAMVHNAALKASIAIATEMFVGLQQDTRNGQSDAANWKCVVGEFQKITVAIGLPHHISVRSGDIFHRCVRKLSLETTARRFEIYNDIREWPDFSCNSLRAYLQDRAGAGLPGGDHCRSKNASLTLLTVPRDSRQPRASKMVGSEQCDSRANLAAAADKQTGARRRRSKTTGELPAAAERGASARATGRYRSTRKLSRFEVDVMLAFQKAVKKRADFQRAHAENEPFHVVLTQSVMFFKLLHDFQAVVAKEGKVAGISDGKRKKTPAHPVVVGHRFSLTNGAFCLNTRIHTQLSVYVCVCVYMYTLCNVLCALYTEV